MDFAVFNEGRPNPKLAYEELLQEEILLMLPPNHRLVDQGVPRKGMNYPWMDLRLLSDESFILHFAEQTTGSIAQSLFDFYDIRPHVLFRTRNTQACAMLCQQGLGACFIPQQYVAGLHWEQPPVCFSVGENGTFSRLTIAYRKGVYLPSYAWEFIHILKEYV